MNRGNFAIEHQQEAESAPYGTRDLPHLSVDITHDTRMPYGTKHLRVMPDIAHNYGKGFEDFTRNDLRDIILHKNKVIADLEEHAYGSASWIDALNKGLKKANEIKDKVDKKPPKETDEEFRKRLEEFDRGSAPTEAWGADELNGDGFFGDIFKQAEKEGKEKWDKLSPEEKLRAEIRQNVRVHQGQAGFFNKRHYEKLAKLEADYESNLARRIADAKEMGRPVNESAISALRASRKRATEDFAKEMAALGGAAPAAEPKAPSGVAAAAAALQPVRTAIQNGIGDAIYGKSDDPKKQKKGLLGISEEGKEESKKKVMKNIVVPVMKWAKQAGQDIEDTANQIFNPEKYEADMKERRIKNIKREEAQAGIVRDKENPMIIIRKPRGMWKADTTDPTVEAYNRKRVLKWNRGAKTEEEQNKEVFYIRVPNPFFAAKLKPSMRELETAGVKLWTGVEQMKKGQSEDVDGTLKQLQDDPFIFIPEDRAKEIYGQLRQFVADKQDEGVMEGYEDEGWTKGQLKAFAKIDPRTLKGQDLIDWKQSKLALDKVTTQNALEKVTKDIAEEEKGKTVIRGERPVRIEPDQARLTKMREAKVRVENRLKELSLRGQQEFKDMMMFQNAEKAKRDAEYYARQKADAQGTIDQADADKAEFDAKPVAERIAILKSYLADANDMENADINEQIEQLQAEEASEKVENQAQGSVDLLQQAEVIGAEGGAKPCWKGYEMIGMKQKGKRTVPNCVPIGGADSESDEEMEGAGAMEYILQKAGMPIFNPSGDTTKAGRQSFTPDYEAYGDDEEQGRLNAFNLSASMYNQSKAIDLPDFKLVKDDTSIRFYRKDDEDVILVGIRGTDFQSWTDFYTWFVIGGRGDLRLTTRFMDDLAKLVAFQRNYPTNQFYYVATGHSLAGSIIDRFLEMGLIEEAITYNPSIEKRHLLDENILNHRVYLDTDPLFILMGQYSPNTEIRVNPNKTNFYNPSKEKDYLIQSHLIYPVSNPALEGGGMEGSGKTYTLEEWKAIFDAKLEQKRQQIEAREAKKKQTAKAKRERAKARRDERDEPPPLETPAVFRTSRVQKATPPKGEPPKKRKPRFKIVAPASARVELREELVAEQPRTEQGKFAEQAETAVVAVSEAPQRAYMKLMKSPIFTETERKLLMRIRETKMSPRMRAVLLGRSGLARKVMEMMGIDESAFQSQRARLRIADTTEKRVKGETVREIFLPEELMALFQRRKNAVEASIGRYREKQKGITAGNIEFVENILKNNIDALERWGLGGLGVVAEGLKNPFGLYYSASTFGQLRLVVPPMASHAKLHQLKFEIEMKKFDDENNVCYGSLGGNDLIFNTGADWRLETATECMKLVLPEVGLDGDQTTHRAGMGRKHTVSWQFEMEGKESVKRWTEAETKKWEQKATEIIPKLKDKISGLRLKFKQEAQRVRAEVYKILSPEELALLKQEQKRLVEAKRADEARTEKNRIEAERQRAEGERQRAEFEEKSYRLNKNLEKNQREWREVLESASPITEKVVREMDKLNDDIRKQSGQKVMTTIKKLGEKLNDTKFIQRELNGLPPPSVREIWKKIAEMPVSDKLEERQQRETRMFRNPQDYRNQMRYFTDRLGNYCFWRFRYKNDRAQYNTGSERFHIDKPLNPRENEFEWVAIIRPDGRVLENGILSAVKGSIGTDDKEVEFYHKMANEYYGILERMGATKSKDEVSFILPEILEMFSKYGIAREELWEDDDAPAFLEWAFGNSLSFE